MNQESYSTYSNWFKLNEMQLKNKYHPALRFGKLTLVSSSSLLLLSPDITYVLAISDKSDINFVFTHALNNVTQDIYDKSVATVR